MTRIPPPLKIVRQRKIGDHVRGILRAKDWFDPKAEPAYVNLALYGDFYVVAQWFEYSDGENTSVEGRSTIALTHTFEHAQLIYDSLFNP